MVQLSQNILWEHWDDTPQLLREAIYAPRVNDNIEKIAQQFHLNPDRLQQLQRLCLAVFLGILHLEQLHREIKERLDIDPKLALEVYHELDTIVFAPYRQEIENNYLTQKASTGTEEVVVQTPKAQQQVVLNAPAQETTINLRTKAQQGLPQEAPAPLKISADTLAAPEVPTPPTPPTPSRPKPFPKQEGQQVPSPAMPEKKPAPQGPIMLHTQEDMQSVGEEMSQQPYRQTSFGGFGGSFKTPFAKRKQKTATRVQVEMPSGDEEQEEESAVSFSAKTYNQTPKETQKQTDTADREIPKTVHYSSLKTDVSALQNK
jgi:hypothetical protein